MRIDSNTLRHFPLRMNEVHKYDTYSSSGKVTLETIMTCMSIKSPGCIHLVGAINWMSLEPSIVKSIFGLFSEPQEDLNSLTVHLTLNNRPAVSYPASPVYDHGVPFLFNPQTHHLSEARLQPLVSQIDWAVLEHLLFSRASEVISLMAL